MDISVFFQAVPEYSYNTEEQRRIGDVIDVHTSNFFPDLEDVTIAFFGVEENRLQITSEEYQCSIDPIREEFYKLFVFDKEISIVDLGTIKAGDSYGDTQFAVQSTCEFLIKKNIIPLIIGGSQDLTLSNYLAYQNLEQVINLVTIDNKLDLGLPEEELNNENYLKSIVLHKPNFLFNLANIGSQRPYNSEESLTLFSKMYFDNLRLGTLFGNINLSEPIIRNADIVSIDLSSIRAADVQGANSGPNGFYADQICQLCKFTGMSDKLSSFGIYEYNREKDVKGTTAKLVAEMMWYFIDGVLNRKKDYPIGSKDNYTKYIVSLQSEDHDIIFYKNPESNRWWMEVPYSAGTKNKYYRNHIIPCTYEDYQVATNDEVPDRWWQTYQKLAH